MSKVKSIPPITATGRELDVLVAERVMGYVWLRFNYEPVGYPGPNGQLLAPWKWLTSPAYRGHAKDLEQHQVRGGESRWIENIPHFSTDIEAAWTIVTHMQTYRRGITPTFFFELQTTNGSDGSGVAARFVSSLHPASYFAIAGDASTAICIAALNALAEHYPEAESETTPPKHRRSNTRV